MDEVTLTSDTNKSGNATSLNCMPYIMDGYVQKHVVLNPNNIEYVTVYFDEPHVNELLMTGIVNGKKQGKAVIMFKFLFTLLEGAFQNDLLDGECTIFYPDSGAIKIKGMAKEGLWWGHVDEYDEEGNHTFSGNYDQGLRNENGIENGQRGFWVAGRKHELQLQLEVNPHKEGTRLLVQYNGDVIVSRSDYNYVFERNGWVCVYDESTGEEVRVCMYENGVELYATQHFFNGMMIECNQNGEVVYRGLYSGDFYTGFKRHTIGVEYVAGSETVTYHGQFAHGARDDSLREEIKKLKALLSSEKEANEKVSVEKMKVDNSLSTVKRDHEKEKEQVTVLVTQKSNYEKELSNEKSTNVSLTESVKSLTLQLEQANETIKTLTNDITLKSGVIAKATQEDIVHKRNFSSLTWVLDYLHLEYENTQLFHSLWKFVNTTSKEINFPNKTSVEVSWFRFHEGNNIEKLVVGDSCFRNTLVFNIYNNQSIKEISVSSDSFSLCNFTNDDAKVGDFPYCKKERKRILKAKKRFCLDNLPKLSSVTIGFRSFADFVALDIKNCACLQQILFDSSSNDWSCNFCCLDTFKICKLPSLVKVGVNCKSAFFLTKSVLISDCELFTNFTCKNESIFANATSLTFSNLGNLTAVDCDMSGVFQKMSRISLTTTPSVTSLKFNKNMKKVSKKLKNVSNAVYSSLGVVMKK